MVRHDVSYADLPTPGCVSWEEAVACLLFSTIIPPPLMCILPHSTNIYVVGREKNLLLCCPVYSGHAGRLAGGCSLYPHTMHPRRGGSEQGKWR